MKNRIVQIVTVLSFVAILTACPPVVDPGAGGGSTLEAKPPAHINVAGAKGLFLQTGGTSKHLRAARDVTGGAGAELMRINTDASTGVATWTDTDGNPVDVTINRTQTIAPGYLLIDYLAAGASTVAVADLSTGDLRSVPHPPANWKRIRTKSGSAFYIADGLVYRFDLVAGVETAFVAAPSGSLDANSVLFPNAAGNVFVYMEYNSQNKVGWYLPADATAPTDISGDFNAEELYIGTANGNGGVIEDSTTGDVFRIGFGNDSTLHGSKYDFKDVPIGIFQGQDFQISTMSITGMFHIGGSYLNDSFDTDGSNIIQLSPDGAGGLRADINAVPLSQVYGMLGIVFRGGVYVVVCVGKYRDGVIYAGGNMDNGGPFLISRFAPSGSTMTVTSPVSVPGITDYDVVGDQIFYTTPNGVYQYNQASGATTPYADAGATIQSVNEAP